MREEAAVDHRVAKLYGSAWQISYFDTPVIVDNSLGGVITKAA